MAYETILTETRGRVRLVTLNRPKALNAINAQLTAELIAAVTEADVDDGIGFIVITGFERAFAAGADIKEMQHLSYAEVYGKDRFSDWDRFNAVRTPVIAAVAGYALGGGCELAMMCDFILAADTAQFGQPEIKLGVMPGMGGMNMNMIKQAQKMQQDMLKAQEELESKTYEAGAGGGVVSATVSGKKELVSVAIDPEAVDPDDVEMLQDLIVAAVNEALRKAAEDAASQMSRLTGGLNLPF